MRHAHKITVTIETDGSAFDDCEQGEVAKILRQVARGIGDGSHALELPPIQKCRAEEPAGDGRRLRDVNGNACGLLKVTRNDVHAEGCAHEWHTPGVNAQAVTYCWRCGIAK